MRLTTALGLALLANVAFGQHFLKRKHGIPPPNGPKANAKSPIWNWITQRLDHFNPTDLREWEMRYISNDQFYEEGGPIFIYMGGEWDIDPGWLMTGLMFDMASENNGMMYYTEHRYYGYSFPLGDLSTESMQYLSLDQAIADIAYFIQYQKRNVPGAENSKVVVVGGSYSATMATWIRKKYPHLVDAAWASSAPLRAVADFHEYFQVVYDNLELATPECTATITEAVRTIEQSLETTDGLSAMSELYNTCDPIDVTEPERSYFFSSLANPFAWHTQYAQPGELEYECGQLLSKPGTPVEKLAAYVFDYYGGWCISDFKFFIDWYQSTELSLDSYRQWMYQTCTEYGFYQTGAQDGRPFGDFHLQMNIDACEQLFGTGEDILNTGIERTNLFYGELNPEVTHVVSVHGTVDPWHAIGVLEDINPLAPVIVVNGTSHCADMYSISENDLPELREAKLRVKSLIAEWIQA